MARADQGGRRPVGLDALVRGKLVLLRTTMAKLADRGRLHNALTGG
ncbi:hypothetical protein ABZ379_31440 [Streptomyces canus]